MKVGMIGLGDIARKAYLPVIGVRQDVELYIATRSADKLQEIGEAHRIPPEHRHTDLAGLLQAGVEAVFIHAATEAHYELIKQCLEQGVHVYVDKPVDYFFHRTKELVDLAQAKRCLLTVGFNRRFAPMYRRLQLEGRPDLVLMQKNRLNLPGAVRTFVLDDFIHVVDMLRMYHPGPWQDIRVDWKTTGEGEDLVRVVFQLVGKDGIAIGVMNRDSGMTEEILEWMQSGRKYRVNDLRETIEYVNGVEQRSKTGDWTSVGVARGFTALVDSFLSNVQAVLGGQHDIWPTIVTHMDEDLATHELCEEIVRRIEDGMACTKLAD